MTPFQRFIVHLSSSMLLNENRGDTIDDIERLFQLADMAMPELIEGRAHDQLAELIDVGLGLYTGDVARIAADLRMHDPNPFDGQATVAQLMLDVHRDGDAAFYWSDAAVRLGYRLRHVGADANDPLHKHVRTWIEIPATVRPDDARKRIHATMPEGVYPW